MARTLVARIPDNPAEIPEYDVARRGTLLNKLFLKADLLAEEVATPRELQQLSQAVAVLIDRKRLEEGDSTSRDERINIIELREKIVNKIGLIAEREGIDLEGLADGAHVSARR